MSLSKLTLGSGAIASVSGLDSSLWKLIKFDTGTYRIINKVTGLLLAQDAKGSVVEETQNSLSAHNEWILVQDPKSVSSAAANLEREVPVTNGRRPPQLFRIGADRFPSTGRNLRDIKLVHLNSNHATHDNVFTHPRCPGSGSILHVISNAALDR